MYLNLNMYISKLTRVAVRFTSALACVDVLWYALVYLNVSTCEYFRWRTLACVCVRWHTFLRVRWCALLRVRWCTFTFVWVLSYVCVRARLRVLAARTFRATAIGESWIMIISGQHWFLDLLLLYEGEVISVLCTYSVYVLRVYMYVVHCTFT